MFHPIVSAVISPSQFPCPASKSVHGFLLGLSSTIHATGFSQWLMTKFWAPNSFGVWRLWEGELPSEPNSGAECGCQANFWQCRNGAFRKNHSPFANRHSLSLSALQEPCYPKNLPTKVGAHGIRHQLRTKVRSMKFHFCVINYRLKPVAWMVLVTSSTMC